MNLDFTLETTRLKHEQEAAEFCRFWAVLGSDNDPAVLCDEFEQHQARAILMKIGGKLVGTTVFWEIDSNDPTYLLAFVGINPNFQGRGLGRTIVEYTLGKQNADWELYADNDNAKAINLYESLGFVCDFLSFSGDNISRYLLVKRDRDDNRQLNQAFSRKINMLIGNDEKEDEERPTSAAEIVPPSCPYNQKGEYVPRSRRR
jgi:ribosomal protein S18 acetylase RimI-like enzyme